MNAVTPVASDVTTVVVIGASGFIGEHLLKELAARGNTEVRVLVHRTRADSQANVSFIEGDLLKPESLDSLFEKGCMVVNLAYLPRHNLEAMENLARACVKNQVRRLIHCSTAVVVGRPQSNWVSETTPCQPVSEYQRTKLEMEAILLEIALEKFEVSILRPSAVFGPGGKNLLKLADQLLHGNMWANYIRSCLFNRRSMNLVCVENVVAALMFLLDAKKVDREVFIISDDDVPSNNYRDVEKQFLEVFGKSYLLPRVPVPEFILATILWLAGKSTTNPTAKFSDRKITSFGLDKPRQLDDATRDFAKWYQATQPHRA